MFTSHKHLEKFLSLVLEEQQAGTLNAESGIGATYRALCRRIGASPADLSVLIEQEFGQDGEDLLRQLIAQQKK